MEQSRFEVVARREVLRRALAGGALLALGPLLAACSGGDDSAALSGGSSSAASTATTAVTGAASSTTTPAAAGPTTTIAFTYTAGASDRGPVRNPYVASWVEDDAGQLVAVVAVLFSQKDAKYLRELTGFTGIESAASQSAIDAVTGATRQAGQYRLSWNGLDLDGKVVTGPHKLVIEAAREHGPHALTSAMVTFGEAGTATIPASGEVGAATVTTS